VALNRADISRVAALGWQYFHAGNLAAADEAVQPWIAQAGNDELVPLIGAIRLQQGRMAEAAAMFERARQLFPREARFAFLHGTALAGLSQFEPAVAAFQAAIRLDANFPDSYMALGMVQRKLGKPEEAQASYRKLLRLKPDHVDAYVSLSAALAETGQFAEAEAPLRRALEYARDPKMQAALHNNLAIALSSQNKHAEALEALERTQALAPDLPDLDQRRIDRLYQLGRYEECLQLYSKLLARDPGDAKLHQAYNSLLYRLGRMDVFLASYDQAPQTRELLFGKARFLSLQKRNEEVEAIYNMLLARDPLYTGALSGWADNLMALGRHQEALAVFESVIARPRATPGVFSAAASAALLTGDPQKAEHLCQSGLRLAPLDQTCWAILGTAWRLQGDERDEGLNRYDHFIRVYDLDPPDGFSSMESFNEELGAYLERLHPKTDAYLDQSLYGGTQTEGMLFGAGHALVEKARTRIEAAIRSFIAELKPDGGHPFLARHNPQFRYSGAWSCLMRAHGFHTNHLHPEGWISSCYYVTVPAETDDPQTRNGWIKFGEPSLDLPLKNPIRRAVQPVPGRLVLFPSYMWHGTIPLQARSARTTIAFDVVSQ
jgi:tetratricopeptide (TPR) repeat protein